MLAVMPFLLASGVEKVSFFGYCLSKRFCTSIKHSADLAAVFHFADINLSLVATKFDIHSDVSMRHFVWWIITCEF